ncbi:hypothetical protein Q3V30_21645 (plasmid) [Erwinia pyri]|uniref:Type III secretion system protein n=1 Tax=Erwinia pyri TaxID=3062598 RepID=A0AA50HNG3_9GAMM|nr:hypothetical protein [Erwinia sp. DE2]WLS81078.1 hypothetical protein Q3V30_21645 [Erwinia sp. DE2]
MKVSLGGFNGASGAESAASKFDMPKPLKDGGKQDVTPNGKTSTSGSNISENNGSSAFNKTGTVAGYIDKGASAVSFGSSTFGGSGYDSATTAGSGKLSVLFGGDSSPTSSCMPYSSLLGPGPQQVEAPASSGSQQQMLQKLIQLLLKQIMSNNSQPVSTQPPGSTSDTSSNEKPSTGASSSGSQSDSQTMATSSEGQTEGTSADGQPYIPTKITGSEKDTTQIPTDDNLKGRPVGDTRSADDIINDNPVLKDLGNQKDIKQDDLKKRFGDWTADNKDPASRADAAYNMAKVLNSIDGMDTKNGDSRTGDGDIQGITKDGDARHGTEAGVLKDVAEQGLGMLKNSDGKYALPQTKDTHVRNDGSNKDNFQWGMGEIGKILSNIPILKSIVAPFFNNIGESKDAGGAILGGLTGLAEGAMSASRGPVGWGITAATDTASIIADNVSGDKKNEPAPFS